MAFAPVIRLRELATAFKMLWKKPEQLLPVETSHDFFRAVHARAQVKNGGLHGGDADLLADVLEGVVSRLEHDKEPKAELHNIIDSFEKMSHLKKPDRNNLRGWFKESVGWNLAFHPEYDVNATLKDIGAIHNPGNFVQHLRIGLRDIGERIAARGAVVEPDTIVTREATTSGAVKGGWRNRIQSKNTGAGPQPVRE